MDYPIPDDFPIAWIAERVKWHQKQGAVMTSTGRKLVMWTLPSVALVMAAQGLRWAPPAVSMMYDGLHPFPDFESIVTGELT
jgi:hypothetical protein